MKKKHSLISLEGATQVMRQALEKIKPPGMARLRNFILSRSDQLPTLRPDVAPLGWAPESWSQYLATDGETRERVIGVYPVVNSEARIYATNLRPMGGDATDAVTASSTWDEGTITGDEDSTTVTNSSPTSALWLTKIWPGCWLVPDGSSVYYLIAKVLSDGRLTLASPLRENLEDDDYTIYRTHHPAAGSWPVPFFRFREKLLYASTTPTELVEGQVCGPFYADVEEVENEAGWLAYIGRLVMVSRQDILAMCCQDPLDPYVRAHVWFSDSNCQVGFNLVKSTREIRGEVTSKATAPWVQGPIVAMVAANEEMYVIEESGRIHTAAEDNSDSSWVNNCDYVDATAPSATAVTKARAQSGVVGSNRIDAVSVTTTGWVQVLINTAWSGSDTGAGVALHDVAIADDYIVVVGVSNGTNATVRRAPRHSAALAWTSYAFACSDHLMAVVWLREIDRYVAADSNGHVWTSDTDAVTWVDQGDVFSGASVTLMEADHSGWVAVAVTDDDKVWYSQDGVSWTEYTSLWTYFEESNEAPLLLQYDEQWGLFRLISVFGLDATTLGQRTYYECRLLPYPDVGTATLTEIPQLAGGSTIPVDVLYNGSITVLATLNGIYTDEGGTWAQDYAPIAANTGVLGLAMDDSAAGSRYLLAVGEQGVIYWTQEGGATTALNAWATDRGATAGEVLYDVAWRTSDNYWVAVGANGLILTKNAAPGTGSWGTGWGKPAGLTADILSISDNGEQIATADGKIYEWVGSTWGEVFSNSTMRIYGASQSRRSGGYVAVPHNSRIVHYLASTGAMGPRDSRPDCTLDQWCHALELSGSLMFAVTQAGSSDSEDDLLDVSLDGGNTWMTQNSEESLPFGSHRSRNAWVSDGNGSVRPVAGIAVTDKGAEDGSVSVYYHSSQAGTVIEHAFPSPAMKVRGDESDLRSLINNPIHEEPVGMDVVEGDNYLAGAYGNGTVGVIATSSLPTNVNQEAESHNIGRGTTLNGIGYLDDGDDTYWLAAGAAGIIGISLEPSWDVWDLSESLDDDVTIHGVVKDAYGLTGSGSALLLLGEDSGAAKIWRASVSSGVWTVAVFGSYDVFGGALRDGVIWSSSGGVLVGDGGEVQEWTGAAFEHTSSNTNIDLVAVSRTSSAVVAVGNQVILRSGDDGSSWDEAVAPVLGNWTDVDYISDMWVAVSGVDSWSAVSADGDTWSRISTDGQLAQAITDGLDVYAVGGQEGRLLRGTEIPSSPHLGFDAVFYPISDEYRAGCMAIAGAQVHLGGVMEWDSDTEEWELHSNRIRHTCQGQADRFVNDPFGSPSYVGAGFIDCDGAGEIWYLVTVGSVVVVFGSNAIGLETPTGNSTIPWNFQIIAEGLWPASNPVLVNQNVYFLGMDGLLYVVEAATSVRRLGASFDLNLGSDTELDGAVMLDWDSQTQRLMVHQVGTKLVYLVDDETGACSELYFPTVEIDEVEDAENWEDYDVCAAMAAAAPGNADLLVSYWPTSTSEHMRLVTGRLNFGAAATGMDDPWTPTENGGGGGEG